MNETRDIPPRIPGWVKWPGIVVGALVVLFVALRLFGLQHGGMGSHTPGGPPGTHAPGGGH